MLIKFLRFSIGHIGKETLDSCEMSADVPTSITISPHLCLLGTGPCEVCRSACELGAIATGAEGCRISDACNSCGICAASCPTGALTLRELELPKIWSSRAPSLSVECRCVAEEERILDAIEVPCLGALGLEALLDLVAAAGPKPVELVDRGWCRSCANGGHHFPPAEPVLSSARAWLREAGWPEDRLPRWRMVTTAVAKRRPARGAVLSRRGLFKRLIAGSPPPPSDSTHKRLGQLARLKALTGVDALPAAAMPAIRVSAACSHDAVCAGVCPTGALATYERNSAMGLAFEPTRCLSCRRCETACPQEALTFTPAGGRIAPHDLTCHATRVCVACDDVFADQGVHEHCPTCRKTRSFFTGPSGQHPTMAGPRPLPNGTAMNGLARGDTTP